jgi:signal recognition particle receptor subunit beta
MPVVNSQAREVAFKIVYYGPGLGGKTTSLQHVHTTTKPEHRGKMVSLATPVDRTLYFDFLPLRVPDFKDLTVRLQLFTVPGQVYYNATRKLVLTGADGVIFVADSQRSRVEANLESLRNLQENLEEQGRSLDEMPHVLQYNKRDLVELVPIEEMEQRLNMHAAPSFASVASSGEGVYEALEAITRAVVEDFEKRMPEHRELIVGQLTVPEGGLADALRKLPAQEASERAAPVDPPGNVPLELRTRASRATSPEPAVPAAEEPGTNPGVGPSARRRDEQQVVSYSDSSRLQGDEIKATTIDDAQFSFGKLWPHSDREVVRTVESALARGDWVTAVSDCATLVERTLAATARLAGESAAMLSPATCCMLLGVDGRKFLEFQRVVSEVRKSCMPSEHEALQAYVFAITLRQARTVLSTE